LCRKGEGGGPTARARGRKGGKPSNPQRAGAVPDGGKKGKGPETEKKRREDGSAVQGKKRGKTRLLPRPITKGGGVRCSCNPRKGKGEGGDVPSQTGGKKKKKTLGVVDFKRKTPGNFPSMIKVGGGKRKCSVVARRKK